MKYPMINSRPRREVNVPQLSGGLNLRDSLTGIRDNQMTDSVNMWYKDGALRTRPSFVTNENMSATSSRAYDDVYIADIKSHPYVKNGDAALVSCIDCDGTFKDGAWQTIIKFFWQYAEKTIFAGSVDCDWLRDEVCKTSEEIDRQLGRSSRLVFEKDGYIYLFLNEKGIHFNVYKAKLADELKWEYISWRDYYVPTVYTHCLSTNNGNDFTGTQFEAYNSLCDSYKMVYSLYNVADSSHDMRYKVPGINLKGGYIIEATIIGKDGVEHKHTVELEGDYTSGTENQSTDKRFMVVVREENWQGIVFTNTSEGDYQNDVIKLTEGDNYAEDNLIITISLHLI